MQEYVSTLNVNLKSFVEPSKWVFWPVDKQGNWVERKDFTL
jgi:hypothetical protein